MIVIAVVLCVAYYSGLFRVGKAVVNHPEQAFRVAATVGKAVLK